MKFLPLIEQYVKVTCIKFQFNWIIRRRVMIFLRFASASNFVAKFTAIQTIPSGPTRNEIRSRDVCLNLQVPPAGLVAPDGHVMRAPPMAKCRHFSNSINDNLQVKTVGFCFNANISSVERPRSWLVRRRTGRCGHRERRLIEFRPFRPPPIWNWDSILLQLDFMAGSSTNCKLISSPENSNLFTICRQVAKSLHGNAVGINQLICSRVTSLRPCRTSGVMTCRRKKSLKSADQRFDSFN